MAGKASVDVKNGEGDTALLKAVALGHVDAVTRLLDGGARVDVKDRRGCSVSFYSIVNAFRYYYCSQTLLKLGRRRRCACMEHVYPNILHPLSSQKY